MAWKILRDGAPVLHELKVKACNKEDSSDVEKSASGRPSDLTRLQIFLSHTSGGLSSPRTSLNELRIPANAGALDLLPGSGRFPKEARVPFELLLHPHGPLVVADKVWLDLSVQVPQPPSHALIDAALVILLL